MNINTNININTNMNMNMNMNVGNNQESFNPNHLFWNYLLFIIYYLLFKIYIIINKLFFNKKYKFIIICYIYKIIK